MARTIPDKYLYFPITGFFIILIIKFIQFSKIMSYFPLRSLFDLSIHMTQLHFLAQYGFLNTVPQWYYGGFRLFEAYPPGWFFFTLPLYKIFGILISVFLSYVLIFIMGFIGVYILGKILRLSFTKILAFYAFFFINPIVIDYAFVIGRTGELLSWVFFILIIAFIFYYMKKDLDIKSLIIIPFYSIILVSHPYTSVLASLSIFLLFLTKDKKNKMILIIIVLLSFLLASFWLIPVGKFVYNSGTSRLVSYQIGELLNPASFISYNTIMIFLFWILFYLYWNQIKDKKNEKIFFLSILILSIITFFRIIPFIPVLNKVPPNTLNLFFIINSLIMFFKLKFTRKIRKTMLIALIILPILSALIVFGYQNNSPIIHTENEKETLKLIEEFNDYMIISYEKKDPCTLINYATIFYNYTAPNGCYWVVIEEDLLDKLDKLRQDIRNKDCSNVVKDLKLLDVKGIITHNKGCDIIETCNFEGKIKNDFCAISFKK